MNGASISVMFNITEGFLRRRNKETLQFLRYSFASNGELKAGYYAAEGRQYITAAEKAQLIEQLRIAGFVDTEHRQSFAGQAYLLRSRKPAQAQAA